MSASASSRLDALTGARFVAAFHVLLFHSGTPLLVGAPAWLTLIQRSGYVAVSFFFVLSGFVLSHHYGAAAERRELDARTFFSNRFSRIYPAYAVALLCMLPLALYPPWCAQVYGVGSALRRTASFAAHALLLQGWAPQTATTWNLPGWSICAEAFFYLSFPALAALVGRARTPSALLRVMGALWLGSLALAGAYLVLRPDGAGDLSPEARGRWLEALKYNPLTRFPEFAFGVCLGRLRRLRPALQQRGGGALAGGACAGLFAVLLAGRWIPYPVMHNGLLLPLFGALVLGLAQGGGALARALSSRPLLALGEGSYSLYILQLPLMLWATVLFGGALPPGSATFRALYLAAAVGLSLASHAWFERPAQRWLRSRFLGTPAASASAPAPPDFRPAA
jgi:peptidoglycan/LPS O-acetylase OafA/YrhL